MTPDVVVVGAGPAGSALAGRLADAGARVALLDRQRFPRPKPCGECLNPGAVAALTRLGLREAVTALGPVALTGWRLSVAGRACEMRFPRGLQALAVDRQRLDEALLRWAARQGARLLEGARVAELSRNHQGSVDGVILSDGSRIPARFVVGADGLHSVVGRRLGLGAHGPGERRVALAGHWRGIAGLASAGLGEIHVQGRLICGMAPVGGDTAVVTVVLPARAAQGGGWAPVLERLRSCPGLAERLARARPLDRPLTAGPFDRPVRGVWAPGAALVGDAAGYFDPLTGQGIYRALRSAELAAPAVLEALAGSTAGLAEYGARLTAEFGAGVRRQRLIDAVVRRPALLTACVRVLSAVPAAGRWFLNGIGDCPGPEEW